MSTFDKVSTSTSTIEQELNIINSMRSKVMSRREITGENLFLAWGYPTVIVPVAVR